MRWHWLIPTVAGILAVVSAHSQAIGTGPAIGSTQLGGVRAGAAGWMPRRVEVFATSAMYIANAEHATVYRVDGRQQLAAELNQNGLPPNPQQAADIVRARVRALGPGLQQRVQAALQAVQAVMVYGVQRVPAVVFDGSRVVYGLTDVAKALDVVRRGGGESISARFASGAPVDVGGRRQ